MTGLLLLVRATVRQATMVEWGEDLPLLANSIPTVRMNSLVGTTVVEPLLASQEMLLELMFLLYLPGVISFLACVVSPPGLVGFPDGSCTLSC